MKKVLYKLFSMVILASISLGCQDISNEINNTENNDWKERWIVGSRRAQTPDCPDAWWVKRNGSVDWTLLYPPFVIGLNYEEGYEYEIIVIAHAEDLDAIAEDSPSVTYTLYEIVSKEEKDSEGIPCYVLAP